MNQSVSRSNSGWKTFFGTILTKALHQLLHLSWIPTHFCFLSHFSLLLPGREVLQPDARRTDGSWAILAVLVYVFCLFFFFFFLNVLIQPECVCFILNTLDVQEIFLPITSWISFPLYSSFAVLHFNFSHNTWHLINMTLLSFIYFKEAAKSFAALFII